jgi:hypothetical protein
MKAETTRRNPLIPRGSMLVKAGVLAAFAVCTFAQAAPGDSQRGPMRPVTNGPDQLTGTEMHYLQLAGSTFHPFGSGTQFAYPGVGCISATGGTEKRFVHKLVLPQDATVKYLRLYAYDESASRVDAFFTTYDAAGAFDQLVSVSSSNGGYVSDLSAEINHVVDHFTQPINIVVNLGTQNDDTLQFCGVRIAYEMPASDVIFENGFD